MSELDSLSRMTRALRESRTGQHADPTESRAAIVTAAAAQRRRRKIGIVWLVPLAAVLVFSTAVASVGSARRLAWRRYIERIVRGDSVETAGTATVPQLPQRVEPGLPDDVPALPEEAPAVNATEPARPKEQVALAPLPRPLCVAKRLKPPPTVADETPPAAPSAEPANAPPAAAPAAVQEDNDSRLYARAHEAHFVRRNPSAALDAWDAYLAALPDGRFAFEARYNRALCLVRLDRLDEAKAALQPFRDGRFGSYRQVEAARLLDALKQR